MDPLVCYLCGD